MTHSNNLLILPSINKKKELEESIRQIELDLSKEDAILCQQRCEDAKVQQLIEVIDERRSLKSKIANSRSVAEALWEETKILEGTNNWKLSRFDESIISIEFKGNVPELSLCTVFKKTTSGLIKCESHKVTQKVPTKLMSKYKKNSKYTPNVLAFFSDKVEILRLNLEKKFLKSIVDVRETVQYIEWSLERLDLIGKEVSVLEQRHNGKLKRMGNSYNFGLSMKSRSKGRGLHVNFRIDDSYPFSVLITNLSGDVNTDSLKRYLARNDKPGFGYLSRTCDMMAALLEM